VNYIGRKSQLQSEWYKSNLEEAGTSRCGMSRETSVEGNFEKENEIN
jgi:hypothetical protein